MRLFGYLTKHIKMYVGKDKVKYVCKLSNCRDSDVTTLEQIASNSMRANEVVNYYISKNKLYLKIRYK